MTADVINDNDVGLSRCGIDLNVKIFVNVSHGTSGEIAHVRASGEQGM